MKWNRSKRREVDQRKRGRKYNRKKNRKEAYEKCRRRRAGEKVKEKGRMEGGEEEVSRDERGAGEWKEDDKRSWTRKAELCALRRRDEPLLANRLREAGVAPHGNPRRGRRIAQLFPPRSVCAAPSPRRPEAAPPSR